MQLTLIYRDPVFNGNQYVTKTFEAPSYFSGKIWDVCWFCAPSIVETNFITNELPVPSAFFSYHVKLAVFFKNRKQ